ncbi:MAG: MFS transporter [Rhodanobacter sp.]
MSDNRGAAPLFSLALVIGTATIFGLTYGLSAPLIALNLAQRGHGEALIGLNAAMHAVGVLLIAPVLPKLAVRFGARPLIITALLVSAGVLVLFPLLQWVALWFPLRILLGAAAEVLFVLSETWTNQFSRPQSRGRTMAIYTAALSLGFAGGPAILALVGTGPGAYLIGAGIVLLAVVPMLLPGLASPAALHPATANMRQYLHLAPIAVGTVVLNAAVETAGLSFIALYATGMGWTVERGMQLVSTLMVGAIVLQLPIGWLADHMSPKRLVWILTALSAAGALLWPAMLATPWLAYVGVFAWGGLFVGIYTVMLTIVGSRFTGGDLVGIYAVMGLAWGAGALVGPSVVGLAMGWSPHYGLPWAIAASCIAFALFMAIRRSDS